MVAVEAAACRVLPISAEHSRLAEVSRTLARRLPEQIRPLASFPLGLLRRPVDPDVPTHHLHNAR